MYPSFSANVLRHLIRRDRAHSKNLKHIREQLALVLEVASDLKHALRVLWQDNYKRHKRAFDIFPLSTVAEVEAFPEDEESMQLLASRYINLSISPALGLTFSLGSLLFPTLTTGGTPGSSSCPSSHRT